MGRIFIGLIFVLLAGSASAVDVGILSNELVLQEGLDLNLGSVVQGEAATRTFTLTNAGAQPIEFYEIFLGFTKVQIMFLGKDFPGTGGTCAAVLTAGESCTFVMEFTPHSLGVISTSARIKYYYGSLLQRIDFTISGEGITAPPPGVADLTVVPASPDFGSLVVNNSKDMVLTVTNNGDGVATNLLAQALSEPFAFNGGIYPGLGGTCSQDLAAGASCEIMITFAPTVEGSFSGELLLSFESGQGEVVLATPLVGGAIRGAELTISGSGTYNFGNVLVKKTAVHLFMVTNSGGAPALSMGAGGLSLPFQFHGGAYPGTGGTCGATLAPKSTCTLLVSFTPSVAGPFADRLELYYRNGPDGPALSTVVRGVSGNGL